MHICTFSAALDEESDLAMSGNIASGACMLGDITYLSESAHRRSMVNESACIRRPTKKNETCTPAMFRHVSSGDLSNMASVLRVNNGVERTQNLSKSGKSYWHCSVNSWRLSVN